jgi:hypothetical protein
MSNIIGGVYAGASSDLCWGEQMILAVEEEVP